MTPACPFSNLDRSAAYHRLALLLLALAVLTLSRRYRLTYKLTTYLDLWFCLDLHNWTGYFGGDRLALIAVDD